MLSSTRGLCLAPLSGCSQVSLKRPLLDRPTRQSPDFRFTHHAWGVRQKRCTLYCMPAHAVGERMCHDIPRKNRMWQYAAPPHYVPGRRGHGALQYPSECQSYHTSEKAYLNSYSDAIGIFPCHRFTVCIKQPKRRDPGYIFKVRYNTMREPAAPNSGDGKRQA